MSSSLIHKFFLSHQFVDWIMLEPCFNLTNGDKYTHKCIMYLLYFSAFTCECFYRQTTENLEGFLAIADMRPYSAVFN